MRKAPSEGQKEVQVPFCCPVGVGKQKERGVWQAFEKRDVHGIVEILHRGEGIFLAKSKVDEQLLGKGLGRGVI